MKEKEKEEREKERLNDTKPSRKKQVAILGYDHDRRLLESRQRGSMRNGDVKQPKEILGNPTRRNTYQREL